MSPARTHKSGSLLARSSVDSRVALSKKKNKANQIIKDEEWTKEHKRIEECLNKVVGEKVSILEK